MADLVERLRQTLPGIQSPAMRGDNLVITLASFFEPHIDSDEMDESETWKRGAVDAANEVLDAIHAHYADRIAALEAEASEGERRGLERAIGLVEARASKHSFLQAKSYEAGLDHAGAMFHTQHCEAHNIAAAIRALIPEAPVREGWLPIETAPKDGTVVDLWHEDFGRQADFKWGHTEHSCGEAGRYCDSDWHSEEAGWVDTALNERYFAEDVLTHWRPLPVPPQDNREG